MVGADVDASKAASTRPHPAQRASDEERKATAKLSALKVTARKLQKEINQQEQHSFSMKKKQTQQEEDAAREAAAKAEAEKVAKAAAKAEEKARKEAEKADWEAKVEARRKNKGAVDVGDPIW